VVNDEHEQDWVMCGIFMCTGQVCSATSRLLVHESIHEDLMQLLIQRTHQLQVGDPLLPETKMGPLVSKEQHDAVVGAIRAAVDAGCNLVAGGTDAPNLPDSLASGYFVKVSGTIFCLASACCFFASVEFSFY
jgi:acyl-CoA reductase-like NAD-dependent aldehyde dehydrogenase